MEDGSWDQVGEEGGEEWHNEEEDNEDDIDYENWHKDDFREDVVSGQNNICKEEILVEQVQEEWKIPPPLPETERGHPQFARGGPRRSYDIRNMDDIRTQKPILGEVLTTNVGFGQTLKRMIRESWGSIKPLSRGALRSPISKIRFTQTDTPPCNTTEECMRSCRDQQKYYMDLGFADIPYNFMIGGDGVLYHGRGWGRQADRSPAFQKLRKTCVDVAYIGDFVDKKIPYEMLSTAADFMKYGLKIARITPFFQSFTYLSDIKRS